MENTLKNLNHYMFTNKLIMSTITNIDYALDKSKNMDSTNQRSTSEYSIKKTDNILFQPQNKDTLFWCFYIIKYGFFKYDLLQEKGFIEEGKEKIKIIEKIRANKDIVKSRKWKLKTLEENLVENKPISLSTFLCACFLENKNIIVKKNNCVYQQLITSDNYDFIEYDNNNDCYGIYTNEDKNKLIEGYLKDCFIVNNINKKIQAQSNYKINDIKEICKKLQISLTDKTGKKYKKAELYDLIKFKLN
jgi:hypothetical protein